MSSDEGRKIDKAATLACIGSVVCWSIGPIFIKYLTGWVDLWTQNLLRYCMALVFWLPYLGIIIKKGRLERGVWSKALLPSGANVFLQSFWAAAFYYIGPALMILLIKSSIIWIAAFSIIFFPQERNLARSGRFWLGVLFSAVGVIGVVLCKEDFAAHRTLVGIIFSLLAAFGWAVYSILAKICFKDIDSRTGFSVVSIYTVAGLLVLAFLFGKPFECTEMGAMPWVSVVVSGITGIAVSHVMYYAAMKRIGATIPSMAMLVTPFTVLALSRIVFGESLNAFQWIFGLVLLVGCGLAIWAQRDLGRV